RGDAGRSRRRHGRNGRHGLLRRSIDHCELRRPGHAPAFFEVLRENPMRTHRFGRKIKLPATIAIKHQVRMRMAQYEIKKVEAEARAEACSQARGAEPKR